MKNQYVINEEVTKEILDSIKKGDMVKCNDWGKPFRVIGVSENYFVMIQKMFKDTYYSVCEKKKVNHSRNAYTEGCFRIGSDDYICGKPEGYNWGDDEFVSQYLAEFERGETELSVRRAVNLTKISVKSA